MIARFYSKVDNVCWIFWTRRWTFGLHKRLRILWSARTSLSQMNEYIIFEFYFSGSYQERQVQIKYLGAYVRPVSLTLFFLPMEEPLK